MPTSPQGTSVRHPFTQHALHPIWSQRHARTAVCASGAVKWLRQKLEVDRQSLNGTSGRWWLERRKTAAYLYQVEYCSFALHWTFIEPRVLFGLWKISSLMNKAIAVSKTGLALEAIQNYQYLCSSLMWWKMFYVHVLDLRSSRLQWIEK